MNGTVLISVALALLAASALGQEEPLRGRLLSVTLDRTEVRPGGAVLATYRWQSVGGRSRRDYRVFVHPRLPGVAEGTYLMFGGDYVPQRPTHRWRPGEIVTEGPHPIPVPANALPGTCDVFVGMYRLSGPRTELDNADRARGDGRYFVTQIKVAADAAEAPSPVTVSLAEPKNLPVEPLPALKPGVTIGSKETAIQLAAEGPVPISFLDKLRGRSLDFAGALPELRVRSQADGDDVWLGDGDGLWTCGEASPQRARYVWQPLVSGAAVGEVRVEVSSDENRFTWHVTRIVEEPGYQIMDLVFPELAAISGTEGWIAVPHDAGRLLPLGKVGSTRLAWRAESWLTPLGAALLGNSRCGAVVSTESVDDQLEVSVEADGPRGSAGISLLHRYDAARPALQFIGQQTPSFTVTFMSRSELRWTEVAARMRSRIATRPNPLYLDRVIYKIFLDSPGAQDYTTFAEALALIRRVSNLTGGAKMIVYLVGWQYHGHDTGYPAVDVVNERLGGEQALVDLIRQARQYGALVGFHDNYDDAYLDSPAWDPAIICRDPGGELMKGGIWAGGQSYVISSLKYAQKYGLKRVDDTLRRFPIEGSYHIDVLSAAPRRIDWNPDSPVSATENLRGKIMILQEFAKHGVDVTSEGFAAPLVGPMRHFRALIRRPDVHVPGEERIPLIPFIYHGCVTYGTNPTEGGGIPEAILYGAKFATDWTKHTPDAQIADWYYLITLPWMKLNARMMADYHEGNGVRWVMYGPGTYVRMSSDGQHYEVSVDGRVIARDYATFCPLADGTWRLYSRAGGRTTWLLPERWSDGSRISVRPLLADGPGTEVAHTIEGRNLVVEGEAGRGYRVAYGRTG